MIKVTWLGQGGFLIKAGQTTIAIDPYLSDSLAKDNESGRLVPIVIKPEDLNCDILISTHDHIDHFDPETILGANEKMTFLAPMSCVKHLKEIGKTFAKVIEFNSLVTYEDNDVKLTAVYANHTEDSIGVIINYDSKTYYFTGDTLLDEKIIFNAKKNNIDVLFVCINGKWGNMSMQEAKILAKNSNASAIVPNHYGMFANNTVDVDDFINMAKDDLEAKIIKMTYMQEFSI